MDNALVGLNLSREARLELEPVLCLGLECLLIPFSISFFLTLLVVAKVKAWVRANAIEWSGVADFRVWVRAMAA